MNARINDLARAIQSVSTMPMGIMEVCGTHTMSIARHGLRSLLPKTIRIISGPGCPVCVTSERDLSAAIELARRPNTLVCTFGDMMKIPAGGDFLSNYKNVRIIYSPLESIALAEQHPDMDIVLLGIGFETTVPLIAATMEVAIEKQLKNFSVLGMNKTVPDALRVILGAPDSGIHGLILPGHVSAITGMRYYDFMRDYPVSGVVTGFEAQDIMESIFLLVKSVHEKKYVIANHYPRAVSVNGNIAAQALTEKYFEPCDAEWRAIGTIPHSGLRIRDAYASLDALKRFDIRVGSIEEPAGCLCGTILMGKATPHECPHFGANCTPAHPIGPCMVSSEGTCAAYFKYGVE